MGESPGSAVEAALTPQISAVPELPSYGHTGTIWLPKEQVSFLLVSSQVAGANILCAVPRTWLSIAQALSSTKEKALYTHKVDFSLDYEEAEA